MEQMTASLESAAEKLVGEVEGLGGMTEALMAGEGRGGEGGMWRVIVHLMQLGDVVVQSS